MAKTRVLEMAYESQAKHVKDVEKRLMTVRRQYTPASADIVKAEKSLQEANQLLFDIAKEIAGYQNDKPEKTSQQITDERFQLAAQNLVLISSINLPDSEQLIVALVDVLSRGYEAEQIAHMLRALG